MADNKPEVAVIMGSASDWETMKHACEMLDQFEVPYMKQVISAHRTPELMGEFAHNARANGLKVIIAGAGGAAHLPGMVAAQGRRKGISPSQAFFAVSGSSWHPCARSAGQSSPCSLLARLAQRS